MVGPVTILLPLVTLSVRVDISAKAMQEEADQLARSENFSVRNILLESDKYSLQKKEEGGRRPRPLSGQKC